MNYLFIISKIEQFSLLLKNRVHDFEGLIDSVDILTKLSKAEVEIIEGKLGAIVFIDGSIVNNGVDMECIFDLAEKHPTVIIKNLYKNDEVYNYLKIGVKGLTSLDNCYTNIVNIINGVKKDEIYLSSNEVGHLFRHVQSALDTSRLTDREQQILPLIMNGRTYSEVASDLDISYETIKSHMKNIYKKLEVRTKSDLLKYYTN